MAAHDEPAWASVPLSSFVEPGFAQISHVGRGARVPLGEKEPAVLWVRAAPCLQRSLRELTALGEAEEGGQALWAVLWGRGHSPLWARTAPAAFAAPLSLDGLHSLDSERNLVLLKNKPFPKVWKVSCPRSAACGRVSGSTRCCSFNLGAPGSGPSSPRAATGRSHAGQSLLGACRPTRPASEWLLYCEGEGAVLPSWD